MEKWEEEIRDIIEQQGVEYSQEGMSDQEIWEFIKAHPEEFGSFIRSKFESFIIIKQLIISGVR